MFRRALATSVVALTCLCGCSPAAINHRSNDAQCSTPANPGDCGCTAGSGGANCSGPEFTCTSDLACSSGVNGRCIRRGAVAGCLCTYDQCSSDTDCPTGQTCACRGSPYMSGSGNSCVAGNCRIDSDCGVRGFCSPSGGSTVGYFCHTPQDTCVNAGECPACQGAPGDPRCVYSRSAGHWQCECVPIPV